MKDKPRGDRRRSGRKQSTAGDHPASTQISDLLLAVNIPTPFWQPVPANALDSLLAPK